jgi:hypothetical protein
VWEITRLPLTQLLAIQPTQGHLCNVCGSCHRTATPSPHPASSRRKPCDLATCPPLRSFPTRPDPVSVALGLSDLGLRPKPRNRPPMVLWANDQTPHARPGLPPSLLTRPPPCTGSIVHDFVLLVSPPCDPHLVPSSTGSLELSLLVSPSPGGPSRLKTIRARSSPATTRTRQQPTPAH